MAVNAIYPRQFDTVEYRSSNLSRPLSFSGDIIRIVIIVS